MTVFMMNFTSIILAGGQSLRMGTDKALISYHGRPLIMYSIGLALSFSDNILICSNQEELLNLGFPVVKDVFPVMAPLAGIHAGLKSSKTDWNLVLTCDMPNIPKQLVEYLQEDLDEKVELVLPAHDRYFEPLCGFYHRKLIPVIEKNILENRLSPLDLLEQVQNSIKQMNGIPEGEIAFIFKNVNSRDDLF
jgi:molybdenum cofactor guanylyltransferase